MLVIAVHFMDGVYHAASEDQESPEWPPHPVRLFYSMVDAYHRTQSTQQEREALLWLEALPPPQIAAEAIPGDPDRIRNPITFFVPTVKKARQPRHFPYTVLKTPIMHFIWPDADPSDTIREGLQSVVQKIYRMGQSGSQVIAYLCEESPVPPNFIPTNTDQSSLHHLRWSFGPGQLKSLEDDYENPNKATMSRYRLRSRNFGYREKGRHHFRSVFGEDWMVFRVRSEGRILQASHTGPVVDELRHRMMIAWGEVFPHTPMPRSISGHNDDASPSQEGSHLAILGLPHVGRHGDGHLASIAFCMPRYAESKDMMRLGQILGRMYQGSDAISMEGLRLVFDPKTDAIIRRWCRPSKEWSTAIPMALDRHPGDLRMDQNPEVLQRKVTKIGETIARSCVHIGLPTPKHIEIHPSGGFLRGSPSIQDLRGSQHGSVIRRYIHARITFEDTVFGPVILGSHRFRGFGLCLPTGDRNT